MSIRALFQNIAPKLNTVRPITTNIIRRSAAGHNNGAGVAGSTLPVGIHNEVRFTVIYYLWMISAPLLPYFAFRFSVIKQAG